MPTPKEQIPRAANWTKWRLIPHAQLWQLVALSLNIDPDHVLQKSDGWLNGRLLNREGREFADRLDVAKANCPHAPGLECVDRFFHLADDANVRLAGFGRFARSVGWEIPPEMPVDMRPEWLARDLWTVVEFIDLLNGGEKDLQLGKAVGALRRAFAAGVLVPMPNPHPFSGDPFLGQYLKPRQAISWACEKRALFPRFPFSQQDLDPPPEPPKPAVVETNYGGDTAKPEKPLSNAERTTLQKQIGALALALAERGGKYKQGEKPNASQIARLASELAHDLPDANARGVSVNHLREVIALGIKALQS